MLWQPPEAIPEDVELIRDFVAFRKANKGAAFNAKIRRDGKGRFADKSQLGAKRKALLALVGGGGLLALKRDTPTAPRAPVAPKAPALPAKFDAIAAHVGDKGGKTAPVQGFGDPDYVDMDRGNRKIPGTDIPDIDMRWRDKKASRYIAKHTGIPKVSVMQRITKEEADTVIAGILETKKTFGPLAHVDRLRIGEGLVDSKSGKTASGFVTFDPRYPDRMMVHMNLDVRKFRYNPERIRPSSHAFMPQSVSGGAMTDIESLKNLTLHEMAHVVSKNYSFYEMTRTGNRAVDVSRYADPESALMEISQHFRLTRDHPFGEYGNDPIHDAWAAGSSKFDKAMKRLEASEAYYSRMKQRGGKDEEDAYLDLDDARMKVHYFDRTVLTSRYAGTNAQEFWAENYAAWVMGLPHHPGTPSWVKDFALGGESIKQFRSEFMKGRSRMVIVDSWEEHPGLDEKIVKAKGAAFNAKVRRDRKGRFADKGKMKRTALAFAALGAAGAGAAALRSKTSYEAPAAPSRPNSPPSAPKVPSAPKSLPAAPKTTRTVTPPSVSREAGVGRRRVTVTPPSVSSETGVDIRRRRNVETVYEAPKTKLAGARKLHLERTLPTKRRVPADPNASRRSLSEIARELHRADIQERVIPAGMVDALRDNIDALNKRADARGMIGRMRLGKVSEPFEIDEEINRELIRRKVQLVEVHGALPRLPGNHRFVASIEHTEDGNIIKAEPGAEGLAKKWGHGEARCDHCNLNRRRKHTIIVANSKGEHKMIGKSCVKDFFGRNVQFPDVDFRNEMEEGLSMSSPKPDAKQLVAASLAMIDAKGYVAGGGTKTDALLLFSRGGVAYDKRGNLIAKVEDKHVKEAQEVLDWVRSGGLGDSDYAHNVRLAVGKPRPAEDGTDRILEPWIDYKHSGYVASAPQAFRRDKAKKVEAEARSSASGTMKHIGEVGKKATFKAKVLQVQDMGRSDFNPMQSRLRIVMQTEDGHIVWHDTTTGTKFSDLISEGVTVGFDGTVKDHRTNKSDQPVTVIQRPSKLKLF